MKYNKENAVNFIMKILNYWRKPRFIQISSTPYVSPFECARVYALDSKGNVWRFQDSDIQQVKRYWKRLEGVESCEVNFQI